MNKAIRYLRRNQMDADKWDDCVRKAANGLIYGYSFYLDALSNNWDGLVLGDYEAVMPLPYRKKFGLYYIYQPLLVAQLGVFGKIDDEDTVVDFLQSIPPHFRLVDLPLNGLYHLPPAFQPRQRMNFVLPLNTSYDTLSANYRSQLKRNLKKAAGKNCTVSKNIDLTSILHLAKRFTPGLKTETALLARFAHLFALLQAQGKAINYGVYEGGKLLASAVFFFSHHRAYYILVGNDPEGRHAGASHLLIDRFIRDHAETGIRLDFEGSDEPTLAFFYSSFGATAAPYTQVRINRLPWFLKWLKAS